MADGEDAWGGEGADELLPEDRTRLTDAENERRAADEDEKDADAQPAPPSEQIITNVELSDAAANDVASVAHPFESSGPEDGGGGADESTDAGTTTTAATTVQDDTEATTGETSDSQEQQSTSVTDDAAAAETSLLGGLLGDVGGKKPARPALSDESVVDDALLKVAESRERVDVTVYPIEDPSLPGIFSDGSQSMAVAVATVQLVSGTDLPSRDTNGFSDPYVKLSLGNSFKRKSKTCWKTLNPVWKEEFVFPLADKSNSTLVMHVWDKDSYRRDDYIGGVEVDLWSLQRDTTHHMSVQLVDTTGKLNLLVTVQDTEPDKNQLTTYDLQQLRSRYGYLSTLSSVKDVGFAEVRVKSASGLRSADFIGKSDPFCVVKLCNSRAQTQTCRNTLDPEWDRVFTFAIKDIHDVFEVSVYDSDHVGGREFLGRVSIPILRVRNGEDQVLALKDQKFGDKCKGRVKLQISYIYNPVRAAIRTFRPREEKLMQEAAKFRKSELMNNFQRVWRLVQATLTALEFVDSCFKWERPARSFVAFLAFILIVWNFEVYMLPIWLLVVLVKNYVDIFLRGVAKTADDAAFELATKLSQDDDDDDENKSFFQRINALQEVLTKVQVVLDELASFGERLNNTVSWGVPFLGWLAIFVLTLLAGVLYYVPLRALVLLWGVNKFTKALRNRGKVKDNNELMDFISRVPCNPELVEWNDKVVPGKSRGPGRPRQQDGVIQHVRQKLNVAFDEGVEIVEKGMGGKRASEIEAEWSAQHQRKRDDGERRSILRTRGDEDDDDHDDERATEGRRAEDDRDPFVSDAHGKCVLRKLSVSDAWKEEDRACLLARLDRANSCVGELSTKAGAGVSVEDGERNGSVADERKTKAASREKRKEEKEKRKEEKEKMKEEKERKKEEKERKKEEKERKKEEKERKKDERREERKRERRVQDDGKNAGSQTGTTLNVPIIAPMLPPAPPPAESADDYKRKEDWKNPMIILPPTPPDISAFAASDSHPNPNLANPDISSDAKAAQEPKTPLQVLSDPLMGTAAEPITHAAKPHRALARPDTESTKRRRSSSTKPADDLTKPRKTATDPDVAPALPRKQTGRDAAPERPRKVRVKSARASATDVRNSAKPGRGETAPVGKRANAASIAIRSVRAALEPNQKPPPARQRLKSKSKLSICSECSTDDHGRINHVRIRRLERIAETRVRSCTHGVDDGRGRCICCADRVSTAELMTVTRKPRECVGVERRRLLPYSDSESSDVSSGASHERVRREHLHAAQLRHCSHSPDCADERCVCRHRVMNTELASTQLRSMSRARNVGHSRDFDCGLFICSSSDTSNDSNTVRIRELDRVDHEPGYPVKATDKRPMPDDADIGDADYAGTSVDRDARYGAEASDPYGGLYPFAEKKPAADPYRTRYDDPQGPVSDPYAGKQQQMSDFLAGLAQTGPEQAGPDPYGGQQQQQQSYGQQQQQPYGQQQQPYGQQQQHQPYGQQQQQQQPYGGQMQHADQKPDDGSQGNVASQALQPPPAHFERTRDHDTFQAGGQCPDRICDDLRPKHPRFAAMLLQDAPDCGAVRSCAACQCDGQCDVHHGPADGSPLANAQGCRKRDPGFVSMLPACPPDVCREVAGSTAAGQVADTVKKRRAKNERVPESRSGDVSADDASARSGAREEEDSSRRRRRELYDTLARDLTEEQRASRQLAMRDAYASDPADDGKKRKSKSKKSHKKKKAEEVESPERVESEKSVARKESEEKKLCKKMRKKKKKGKKAATTSEEECPAGGVCKQRKKKRRKCVAGQDEASMLDMLVDGCARRLDLKFL